MADVTAPVADVELPPFVKVPSAVWAAPVPTEPRNKSAANTAVFNFIYLPPYVNGVRRMRNPNAIGFFSTFRAFTVALGKIPGDEISTMIGKLWQMRQRRLTNLAANTWQRSQSDRK
jgi:hypothetical protein